MDLSIVIATCNSGDFIGPCLDSILQDDSLRTEIIVVDNASRDRTVETIRARFPRVTLLVNQANSGHCRATNRGLAAATAPFVMVLDADTIILPGTLRHIVEFLRAHPEVAIAAPRMLNVDGSLQETARAFPTVANAVFGRQTVLTRLFPNNRFSRAYLRRDRCGDNAPFAVDWVSAACMAFRRSLVARLGPWDEGFGGYWVDADWCARAHIVGRVYCVPEGRVVHVEQNRRDRRKGSGRIRQFHAGVYRFYRKHYTRGVWDPRALAAAAALSLRAALLVVADLMRSPEPAPTYQRGPAASAPVTAAIGDNER
jgi:N-acetylglucosaminyl-diphospho-decaprenol L-rhamnosyltransferase